MIDAVHFRLIRIDYRTIATKANTEPKASAIFVVKAIASLEDDGEGDGEAEDPVALVPLS